MGVDQHECGLSGVNVPGNALRAGASSSTTWARMPMRDLRRCSALFGCY